MRKWQSYKNLGDVVTIIMGQSPSSDTYNDKEGLPFFQGNADFGKEHPTVRVFCNSPIRIAEPNDILISVRAPIGAINIADRQCCIGRGLAAIRGANSVSNRFLYFFLTASKNTLISQGTGSTFKSIGKDALKNLQMPVFNLNEQERIVSELDLLAGIIDKQKQQLKELDTLAQSIFYDMFGNPVENDKGWEKKQIGKICTSKKQIQRASKRFKDSDIIRYIDISSIDNINNVMTSTTSYGFGDAPSRAQQVVEIGDVLISLVRPNLNNVAMVSEDGTDLVASSGFCVLRANCEIVKEFLFYSVKMKCFTDYLMQRVSGANYPAVREDDIMGYNIILPPLELQESFAQKIQSIESQKQSINRSLAESQKLFDYTMDKYFG